MTARTVAVLGSTGSIGVQALEIIAANPDRFELVALAAGGGDLTTLAEQVAVHAVPLVAVAGDRAGELREAIGAHASASEGAAPRVEVISGPEAVTRVAGCGADVVLNGITGSVGLGPSLAAIEAGSVLALANKESLVAGGALVRSVLRGPDQLVPVDSEHSAIAQALRSGSPDEVDRLILTASGGPFRGWDLEQLTSVTPAQALAHPTWSMGPMVTTNSASLMNKGLELIEAHLLFELPVERIDVVVHPQSVVHSMVAFCDGSTIAQASPPDMRLPIALGLAWPERVPGAARPCRWDEAATWTFEPVDHATFPALDLARSAVTASPSHPAVLNAANEEAVVAFLDGRLPFVAITDVVRRVLDEHDDSDVDALSLEGVQAIEEWARRRANDVVAHTSR